jgi:hypothetical protein
MAAVGEKNYRPIINLGDKKNEQLCESMRWLVGVEPPMNRAEDPYAHKGILFRVANFFTVT